MILLIVTIGLLNICLGFGLAIYYSYGPPGLDGIFEALGPMPPPGSSAESLGSSKAGAPYEPLPAPVEAESTAEPGANPPASDILAPPLEPLAEEEVLGDVCDLAATAQTALVNDQVESHE